MRTKLTARMYDVVRLRTAAPEYGLAAGAIGAVVMVHEKPPGYEVEFCDAEGVTLALLTLRDDELEVVT